MFFFLIGFTLKQWIHTAIDSPSQCCCCLVARSCLTLCKPMDHSPPGFSVHEISISYSRGSSQPRDQTCISCIGSQIFYCWPTRKAPQGQYSSINQNYLAIPISSKEIMFIENRLSTSAMLGGLMDIISDDLQNSLM